MAEGLNMQKTSLFMWYTGNISCHFFRNSEASASELLEEKILVTCNNKCVSIDAFIIISGKERVKCFMIFQAKRIKLAAYASDSQASLEDTRSDEDHYILHYTVKH